MPLAALASAILLAALQGASPQPGLELSMDGAWVRWRAVAPGAPAVRDSLLERAIIWIDSQPGLRLGRFAVRPASRPYWDNSVAVLEVEPARYRFELAARPAWERRSADVWLRDSLVTAALNTGLFEDGGTPEGLVVIDGASLTPPAAWLDVLVVLEEGVLRLADPGDARAIGARASAFQTLPWLVRAGRVVFGTRSGVRLSRTHRDRRLTLCLGGEGRVRVLLSNFEMFGRVIGRIPVGLTIPEQAAIAAAIGCRDAVALDGGISAQLFVRGTLFVHRMPGWRRIPLTLLLRRR